VRKNGTSRRADFDFDDDPTDILVDWPLVQQALENSAIRNHTFGALLAAGILGCKNGTSRRADFDDNDPAAIMVDWLLVQALGISTFVDAREANVNSVPQGPQPAFS
jgi:hypothetical protein